MPLLPEIPGSKAQKKSVAEYTQKKSFEDVLQSAANNLYNRKRLIGAPAVEQYSSVEKSRRAVEGRLLGCNSPSNDEFAVRQGSTSTHYTTRLPKIYNTKTATHTHSITAPASLSRLRAQISAIPPDALDELADPQHTDQDPNSRHRHRSKAAAHARRDSMLGSSSSFKGRSSNTELAAESSSPTIGPEDKAGPNRRRSSGTNPTLEDIYLAGARRRSITAVDGPGGGKARRRSVVMDQKMLRLQQEMQKLHAEQSGQDHFKGQYSLVCAQRLVQPRNGLHAWEVQAALASGQGSGGVMINWKSNSGDHGKRPMEGHSAFDATTVRGLSMRKKAAQMHYTAAVAVSLEMREKQGVVEKGVAAGRKLPPVKKPVFARNADRMLKELMQGGGV